MKPLPKPHSKESSSGNVFTLWKRIESHGSVDNKVLNKKILTMKFIILFSKDAMLLNSTFFVQ